MNKIVTICGSMKFVEQMKKIAVKLEIVNKYIVIQCVYTDDKLNEEEQSILSKLHYKKSI